MKAYFFTILLGLGSFACQNHDTSGETISFPADSVSADGSMSFHGLRINESNAIPLAELKNHVLNGGAEQVKIVGEINECCQAKGCWMTMPLDENHEMRVKFKDYGFFVPKDAGGKIAVVEGQVFTDTVSVEDRRHYAIDGGMSKEEAEATITEPEISLAFEATGVIIKSK